jgi:integrase
VERTTSAAKLNATARDHFAFPHKILKGTVYNSSQATKDWRNLTKAAGLPGFCFHDLRHTFITNHAEMGTPLPLVMVGGHRIELWTSCL